MKNIIHLGILIIFIGFLLIFIGSIIKAEGNTKIAVGGFIGFIPFGFGNDKKIVIFTISLSLLMFWLWLMFKK